MKLFAFAAAFAAVLCAQPPRELPIANLPPDTVVAVSDGKPITAGEIRHLLETGDPRMVGMAKQSPDNFLGNVFVTRFLAAEGEKAHLADESPLKEQLQTIRDQLVGNAWVNQFRETYSVPENAITDFYAQNQSRYEMAHIKVIAIGFCPAVKSTDTSAKGVEEAAKAAMAAAHCTAKRSEEQAHDFAVGLVGQIRGGADFVKLVKKYSEDEDSKATDGDFGLVTRDNSFKPEIKQAVFMLNQGDVSDPIPSGTFFYIIKIKDKSIQPLENVREPIIQELKQKHFTDWLTELNRRFKPEIKRPDFFTSAPGSKPGGPPQLVPPQQ